MCFSGTKQTAKVACVGFKSVRRWYPGSTAFQRTFVCLSEMEEFVKIPKKLIVELLSTENMLSSVVNLPPIARPIVERCAAKIREIAVRAGLRIGSTSSLSENYTVSVVSRQGM